MKTITMTYEEYKEDVEKAFQEGRDSANYTLRNAILNRFIERKVVKDPCDGGMHVVHEWIGGKIPSPQMIVDLLS